MNLEELKAYRRDLHKIPELGFDLVKTHQYVKEKLESFGYVPKVYAKTGLVAVKKGKKDYAIAFRADMDALPVHEATDVSFKSLHDGKMHACGHDGHTSMLLGFAKYVSQKEMPEASIVFLFQPAEEGPGGAKVMIEEGVLSDYNVKKIFGLHLFPGLDEGLIGIKDGPMLARNAEFDFDIIGVSSHGAQPHQGKDAVLAASMLVTEFNQIISRYIDPLEPAVITTGTINGGEARNIIANKVSISGTIRAFNDDVFETLKQKMNDMIIGVEKSYGVTINGAIVDYYPAVVNDHDLYFLVKKTLDPKVVVDIKPYTFSEDFAYYQKAVPGIFSFIGSRNVEKGFTHPLHSNFFNFDEKVLLNGYNFYVSMSKSLGLYQS